MQGSSDSDSNRDTNDHNQDNKADDIIAAPGHKDSAFGSKGSDEDDQRSQYSGRWSHNIRSSKDEHIAPQISQLSAGGHAIRSLCRTCTYFYNILSPYLFRRIVLRKTLKSGSSVRYLANTSQCTNIKLLHFKAAVPAGSRDINRYFPPSVQSVLCNLASFPNVETLILDFNFQKVDGEDPEDLMMDEDEETEEQIKEAENRHAWRALQKRTFQAVTQEGSNNIREQS